MASQASAPNLLSQRVRSFPADPLHSNAYLGNLLAYLTQFLKTEVCNTSEVVFLTGFPSPEWIDAVVTRFSVDLRFLQSHLDFVPNAQRNWYTSPSLPSRNRHLFRLRVPSIVFGGIEGTELRAEELHAARKSCAKQLLQKAKAFHSGAATNCGQSIVRRINIHRGDAIILEQEVSVIVLGSGESRKFIIWSDAGEDAGSSLSLPDTPYFQTTFRNVEHCPIFFEKQLRKQELASVDPNEKSTELRTRQPLGVLPLRYGETMEQNKSRNSSLWVLQELFQFQAAAANQYLNMLREITLDLHARTALTGDSMPTMEALLHVEYTKEILVSWMAHFRTLLKCLNKCSLGTNDPKDLSDTVEGDFEYLLNEAQSQIDLCEMAKSTNMSSFSVFNSRQASEESKLVTKLTKATNRITLIFLPISLVTSIFGMNFRQFGQGPLSISVWAMVTVPLLCLCILISEWGGALWYRLKRCLNKQ
ncbi:hypothetical protein FB567DRAFT_206111 [Paraphoma chrysanthemicola]|uniref:Uncharacterized protein n=1 Tax=Paraphoma chrysanthemicola TaxID=798071 RepID=A0A8K0VT51_9PLEO|nr:hypothetical protein FB567DRAFT_206111 [Paraphoma chrysanthemicola]